MVLPAPATPVPPPPAGVPEPDGVPAIPGPATVPGAFPVIDHVPKFWEPSAAVLLFVFCVLNAPPLDELLVVDVELVPSDPEELR